MIDQARSALEIARNYLQQGKARDFRFWHKQAQVTRRLAQLLAGQAVSPSWETAFEWHVSKEARQQAWAAINDSTDDEGAYMDWREAQPPRPILPGRREPAREEALTSH